MVEVPARVACRHAEILLGAFSVLRQRNIVTANRFSGVPVAFAAPLGLPIPASHLPIRMLLAWTLVCV